MEAGLGGIVALYVRSRDLTNPSQTRTTTLLGKNQKNDHQLDEEKATKKKALRTEEDGAYLQDAANDGP